MEFWKVLLVDEMVNESSEELFSTLEIDVGLECDGLGENLGSSHFFIKRLFRIEIIHWLCLVVKNHCLTLFIHTFVEPSGPYFFA